MPVETPKQREQRRPRCYQALTEGLGEKLQLGGTGGALDLVEKANAQRSVLSLLKRMNGRPR